MRRLERMPLDAGLQPERTELSWRRTLLALAAASIAAVRALQLLIGGRALIVGACCLAASTVLTVLARRRVDHTHRWFRALLDPSMHPATTGPSGGALPLAITLTVACGAASALTLALVSR